jgi:protein SCO1/2
MSKKKLFYVIFFSALVVGFFVVMSFIIPGFTKPSIPPISSVKPFSFINQDGQVISEKNLEGKVAAVEYFFTSCKGICPRLNNNLRTVYDEFKDQKDFIILSHTSDPETDSASRLKQFADSMQVDTKKWMFITGRKDSLYTMARYSYKIDDPANNLQKAEDDFLHTQFIALVNKQGDVLKIYDGLKQTEMNEMKKAIAELLKK